MPSGHSGVQEQIRTGVGQLEGTLSLGKDGEEEPCQSQVASST